MISLHCKSFNFKRSSSGSKIYSKTTSLVCLHCFSGWWCYYRFIHILVNELLCPFTTAARVLSYYNDLDHSASTFVIKIVAYNHPSLFIAILPGTWPQLCPSAVFTSLCITMPVRVNYGLWGVSLISVHSHLFHFWSVGHSTCQRLILETVCLVWSGWINLAANWKVTTAGNGWNRIAAMVMIWK